MKNWVNFLGYLYTKVENRWCKVPTDTGMLSFTVLRLTDTEDILLKCNLCTFIRDVKHTRIRYRQVVRNTINKILCIVKKPDCVRILLKANLM